jgi:hypothetical protein
MGDLKMSQFENLKIRCQETMIRCQETVFIGYHDRNGGFEDEPI